MIIIFFSMRKIKLTFLVYLINIINIIIFYYLLGPSIEIFLLTFSCENGQHKYLISYQLYLKKKII